MAAVAAMFRRKTRVRYANFGSSRHSRCRVRISDVRACYPCAARPAYRATRRRIIRDALSGTQYLGRCVQDAFDQEELA